MEVTFHAQSPFFVLFVHTDWFRLQKQDCRILTANAYIPDHPFRASDTVFFALCRFPLVAISHAGNSMRTQPRIKHVQCHLVALLCAGNGYKPLIAVILRLVDLDHTTTELPNLVDLGSTFANDCSNHIIRNEDLLRKRLARYHALHRLGWWPCVALGRLMWCMLHGLMRTSCSIRRLLRRTAIVHRSLRLLLLWRLSMEIRDTIRVSRCAISLIIVSFVVVRVAIVTTGRLRYIRHNLHAARNNTRRSTTSRSI